MCEWQALSPGGCTGTYTWWEAFVYHRDYKCCLHTNECLCRRVMSIGGMAFRCAGGPDNMWACTPVYSEQEPLIEIGMQSTAIQHEHASSMPQECFNALTADQKAG